MNKKYFPEIERDLNGRPGCIIIPFPGQYANSFLNNEYYCVPDQSSTVINGQPGEKLPENIPDFRPHLQRDGLILLSWDKRICEKGALYTAYWVTSTGIHRYYASRAVFLENFPDAMPYRKSYAAEDGIDFYGEKSPYYIVHVAPELMMSSRHKKTQRPLHIRKLKDLGVDVDFNYNFLLTRERKRYLCDSRGA